MAQQVNSKPNLMHASAHSGSRRPVHGLRGDAMVPGARAAGGRHAVRPGGGRVGHRLRVRRGALSTPFLWILVPRLHCIDSLSYNVLSDLPRLILIPEAPAGRPSAQPPFPPFLVPLCAPRAVREGQPDVARQIRLGPALPHHADSRCAFCFYS